MDINERINSLIQSKNFTKREFAKRLRDLEPKLKSTGETPTEKTIYKYLDGSNAIKIELIPYIAEALQITEQELFTYDKKSRKKYFENLMRNISTDELEILRERFNLVAYENSSVKEPTNNYNENDELKKEIIELLPYAPKPLLENLKIKLKELKEFNKTI
ncbi:hypothetical protein [Halarcobacter bivalviorum]|uniref:HTH cro/C1-type domain-containing protein n=1 Tax=Halarcobacter bivalviorum TaxID=663364 RepID=A0AAX2AB87_9BACT|nr:hypothetical protein [Halarcobacter bivalviorum]AXH11988.1 hypothetical protein ABIV_0982 [Halarcobacter bivalviorum]RXK11105.1 hypothetical protein CRV05_01685 [Halarcobacter bivalviorum]